MSAKQDRHGARTPADLERRYNFGQSFAEVMGLANDARKYAEEAKVAAENASKSMTAEEVFNILTNNGANQGLYRGEDGELYINASYIKSGELLAELLKTGVITSKDGTVKLDLSNNRVTIDGTRNGYKTQIVLSSSGIVGYGESTEGEMENVLTILMGVGGLTTGVWNDAWKESTGLSIGASSGVTELGTTEARTKIYGSYIDINSIMDLKILGKAVEWKSNGDGTYTLIGTD